MSGLSTSGSQSPKASVQTQRRSIVDVLHELQRQIQAKGSGPFTPEQSKEIEKLKALYIKAKQEYDRQMKLLQSMASASNQQGQGTTLNQVIAPTNIQIVNTVPGGSVSPLPNQAAVLTTSSVTGSTTLLAVGSVPQQVQSPNLLQGHNLVTVSSPGLQNVVVGSIPGVASGSVQALSAGLASVTTLGQDSNAAIIANQARPSMSIGNLGNQIPLQASTLVSQQQQPQQQQQTQQSQQLRMSNLTAHRIHSGSPNIVPATQGLNKSRLPVSGLESAAQQSNQVLTRKRIQDLLHEIDPRETMDEDVEEVLLQMADDFIENVINSSCQLAKHRKSSTLDVKDVQLHLDRHWHMWIPGYGNEDVKPPKKLSSTEAHRQRMALIRKSLKK